MGNTENIANDAPEEVPSRPPHKASRRREKIAEADDEAPEEVSTMHRQESGEADAYFWQDPSKRQALGVLREESAKRRRRRDAGSQLEKDGITLVKLGSGPVASLTSQVPAVASPRDFLSQEMFGRRKRRRTATDRKDRNVLGRMGT